MTTEVGPVKQQYTDYSGYELLLMWHTGWENLKTNKKRKYHGDFDPRDNSVFHT